MFLASTEVASVEATQLRLALFAPLAVEHLMANPFDAKNLAFSIALCKRSPRASKVQVRRGVDVTLSLFSEQVVILSTLDEVNR